MSAFKALWPQLTAFPLRPILREPDQPPRCTCNEPKCPGVGKHPAVLWSKLTRGQKIAGEKGCGYGICTGFRSGFFAVDCDGAEGVAEFEALGPHPPTLTVKRGEGKHFYFNLPIGFEVANSVKLLGKRIDIRGEGGMVVGPGSPHKSGDAYEVEHDIPIADPPEWLVEWLRARPAAKRVEAQSYEGDCTDAAELEHRRALFVKDCQTMSPSIEGQGGDAALYKVVQVAAHDYRLPNEDILAIVREHFDPRCVPPWGAALDERVMHKAHDAKMNSTRPRAEPEPAALADLGDLPPQPTAQAQPAPALPTLGETWGGWDATLEPPVYLVHGLIPANKVVTFFAAGGSLKTWAMLSLAIAVATGKPWLGKYAVKKGKALYLDWEDGPYEFRRRVRMLTGGQDVPDLGYLYVGTSLTIDKGALWTQLTALARARDGALVVGDSLSAGVHAEVDENSREFSEGLKMAARFTEEVPGCTVGFVHHANKSGGMRGSSTIRDQSDIVFGFEEVGEEDGRKRMRMVCDKPGPQRRPLPVNIELTDAGVGTFEDQAADRAHQTKTAEDLVPLVLRQFLTDPRLSLERIKDRVRHGAAKVESAVRMCIQEKLIRKIDEDMYELEGDIQAQKNRVLAAVRSRTGRTNAELAQAAGVSAYLVARMLLDKEIYPSAEGGFVDRGRG